MAARESYNRLHTDKISLIEEALSKPLQPEPKINIEIPKPEPCEDPMKVEPDYECTRTRTLVFMASISDPHMEEI